MLGIAALLGFRGLSVVGSLIGAEVSLVDQKHAFEAADDIVVLAVSRCVGVDDALGWSMFGYPLVSDHGDGPDAFTCPHRTGQLDVGPSQVGHDTAKCARRQSRQGAESEGFKDVHRSPENRSGIV